VAYHRSNRRRQLGYLDVGEKASGRIQVALLKEKPRLDGEHSRMRISDGQAI
jgi:hypothetical protein